MTDRELWNTAIHEAGHAIVAVTLGVKLDRLRIKNDPLDNSSGFVVIRLRPLQTDRFLESLALVYMAGNVAERCYLPKNEATSSRGDIRKTVRSLLDIYYHKSFYANYSEEEQRQFLKRALIVRDELLVEFFQDPTVRKNTHIVAKNLARKRKMSNRFLRSLNLRFKLRTKRAMLIKRLLSPPICGYEDINHG